MGRTERGLWMLLVAALILGFVSIGPPDGADPTGAPGPGGPVITNPTGPTGPAIGTGASGVGTAGSGIGTSTGTVANAASCAPGRNGGRTDKGISATQIRLAATVVLDGPAASLLRHSLTGMQAVFNKVNQAGGICGREIVLTARNDSFDARTGQQYIRNFIEEDYFALAVTPSAEGLGSAISTGDISRAGIPVVGTDGMRKEQYADSWVWPVATATVSTMRVMAEYAYKQRGARSFAIIYDDKYKFGKEGKDAFVSQVRSMGGTVKAQVALNPGNNSFASEANNFNGKCASGCDMVALLLLPDTAETWLKAQPSLGTKYTAGAQTLFTTKFAQDCIRQMGVACHGIAVWTGYNPPIGTFAGLPGVNQYINDVRAVDPGAPVDNQFMEGAYLGATLLVKALQKVGANLTRANLKAALDAMDLRTDLARSPVSWRGSNHAANIYARGFSIVYSGGSFLGWRDDNTGFRPDPRGGPTK